MRLGISAYSASSGAQAKFALWGLDQDDEFYEKPGLWKTLMSDEIGLDDTQVEESLNFNNASILP